MVNATGQQERSERIASLTHYQAITLSTLMSIESELKSLTSLQVKWKANLLRLQAELSRLKATNE